MLLAVMVALAALMLAAAPAMASENKHDDGCHYNCGQHYNNYWNDHRYNDWDGHYNGCGYYDCGRGDGNTYGNVFIGGGGFYPSYGNTYGNVFIGDGFSSYWGSYPYWGYDPYCGCYCWHYWWN